MPSRISLHMVLRPTSLRVSTFALRFPVPSRSYAIQAPGGPTVEIFNQHTKWMQKERSASSVSASRDVDYLRDEVARRMSERLLDINRSFDNVLDLGAQACNLARALTTPNPDPLKTSTPPVSARIKSLTCADSSATLLHRDASLPFNNQSDMQIHRTVLSTSETLPFSPSTFDAVLSNLSLHWINDLPSVLAQIHSSLKPDSPFMAAMLGGDSLYELRTSLQLASLERRGGVAPHTSPLADVRDVGGLLQRAGFRLLTVDVDDVLIEYPSSFALMRDLQAMGESSALVGREMGPIGRDVLLAAEAIYRELHGEGRDMVPGLEGDKRVKEGRGFVDVGERQVPVEKHDTGGDAKGNTEGVLPATFRIIWMIGWKEGPGQQAPLQRGSGMLSIKDILEGGDGKGQGKA